jgi:hypothetical protein
MIHRREDGQKWGVPARENQDLEATPVFSQSPVMCAMLFWQIGNGVPRSGHYRSDTGRENEHPEDHQRLQDGRSRNAPEDHSPMDVAAEGQAADARAGSRLCEEGSRAE